MRIITVLFFTLLVLLVPKTTYGQWVTIPDPNFVAWLNNNGFAGALNGSDLDTTHSLVTGSGSIDCSFKSISDLYGIQFFDNLQSLNCAGNSLINLPSLPSNLTYLDCSSNQLTSLPSLPSGLTYLECSFNQLVTLPNLPPVLSGLSCFSNSLTLLPQLPNSLQFLDCQMNQLGGLPLLPPNLEELNCRNNSLISLPPLPATLLTLSCSGNPIPWLPNLPVNLERLECAGQTLLALPSLPTTLEYLICFDNQLDSLPSLPPSLLFLNCSNNLIQSISSLPPQLSGLYCEQNLLSALPPLPATIKEIQCANNQLTSIPELPDSLISLNCSGNASLSCLPELKKINYLGFTGTNIQCLPNYGMVLNSSPPLNSLPLCDIFNLNSCDFYYNIGGHVYADDNSNCIDEPTESSLPDLKINVTQAGTLVQQVYTSQTGLYTIDTQLGTYNYTVDTTGVPFVVNCPVSASQTSTLTFTDSTDLGMDFGLQCKPGFDIGVVTVHTTSGQFFPADTASIYVTAGDVSNLYNLTCASGISGAVTVYFTGPVQFAGALPGSLIPAVTPNTLTYTISDFGAVNMLTDFGFNFITDTMAQAGQQVCFSVDVTPSAADLNPMNNMYTHCFTVVNSYDPNVKEANPIAFTTPDNWITYTIHFQNTGTAPAQHIVITDTLDTDVQEGTFTFLASSHQPFINVTGNVIKFTFPNINLPDSTSDEPGSHGWVQYKVKSDPGLALGTTIENTANIYFDFNPPVITNTTVNTVVLPTSIQEADDFTFNLSPNPAAFETNIRTLVNGDYRIRVIDMTGRTIYQNRFQGNTYPLQVENWPKGLFVVELQDSQGKISRRPLMTGN